MKLSPMDARILRYIVDNGLNQSERVIAKELRISPTTFSYRIRKMEEEKVILSYRYRLDFSKLGKTQYAWVFFKVQHNASDPEKHVQTLLANPCVQIVMSVTGEYDLAMKVCCRDMDEVTKLVLDFESGLRDYIISSATYFITKNYKSHQMIPKAPLGQVSFDDLDLKLLKYRVENPNASIQEISSVLSMHRNTVSGRLRGLFENGVIIKKSAVINPDYYADAGVAFKVMVFFDAMPGKKEKLAEALAKFHYVHDLSAITFPHDILAIVRTADLPSFYALHKNFYAGSELAESTNRIDTIVVLHSVVQKHPDYFGHFDEKRIAD